MLKRQCLTGACPAAGLIPRPFPLSGIAWTPPGGIQTNG